MSPSVFERRKLVEIYSIIHCCNKTAVFLILFSSVSRYRRHLKGHFPIVLLPVSQFNSLYSPSAIVLIRASSHPINESPRPSLSARNQSTFCTFNKPGGERGIQGLELSSGGALLSSLSSLSSFLGQTDPQTSFDCGKSSPLSRSQSLNKSFLWWLLIVCLSSVKLQSGFLFSLGASDCFNTHTHTKDFKWWQSGMCQISTESCESSWPEFMLFLQVPLQPHRTLGMDQTEPTHPSPVRPWLRREVCVNDQLTRSNATGAL